MKKFSIVFLPYTLAILIVSFILIFFVFPMGTILFNISISAIIWLPLLIGILNIFKELTNSKVLDMENFNNVRIVNITGVSRSGKDTCYEILNINLCRMCYAQIAIADPVKKIAKVMHWDGEKDEAGRLILLQIGYAAKGNKNFPEYDKDVEKKILYWIGVLYPYMKDVPKDDKFWTTFCMHRISKVLEDNPKIKNVFITDMRFESEFKMFHEVFPNIIDIRIIKPDVPVLAADQFLDSLYSYVDKSVVYIIENNGTYSEYVQKVANLGKEIGGF